ncbi:MAG TPA: UbiA family prenyltransferase [Chloroflexota bacterium]|nr:UbiA family prenyltransferase [Chloroflexota bacterium]
MPPEALPSSVSWGATLHGWLTTARISNSPTIVSNVLVGAALAGIAQPTQPVVLLIVAMILYYTAGMILNDVCDFSWDREHRPTRPMPAGLVPRSAGTAAVVALFVVGTFLAWLAGGLNSLLSGLVLIGLIVFYDAWHKSNPLSPWVMAACRVMVYVTAFVAFAWPLTSSLAIACLLLVLYMGGLTAIAKTEAHPGTRGYFSAAILFMGPFFYGQRGGSLESLVLATFLAGWILFSLHTVYGTQERNIGLAIGRLIAGISLFDALVLTSVGATTLVTLAIVAFGLTLVFQRYVEGT